MEKEFDQVFAIMDEAFPDNEMRTYEGQLALLENPNYGLRLKKDDHQRVIAFMAVWEFENFAFIEHLAVARAARGSGIGGKLVEEFLREYASISSNPVILEVEPPHDDFSTRRIEFYKRFGFYYNDFLYEQPPMRATCDWCPLQIMSFPNPVGERAFEVFKKVLYEQVYRVK